MRRHTNISSAWAASDLNCPVCKDRMYFKGYEPKGDFLSLHGIAEGSFGSKKFVRRRRATIDHIIPKSKGGCNAARNKMVMCSECNCSKGSMSIGDFLGQTPKHSEVSP